jgi:uncharacterized RDD family membrane protein YckC
VNHRTDTVRTVEAPEGVELALHVAGPYPRAFAYAIDFLIRSAVLSALAVVLFLGPVGLALYLLAIFASEWFYPVVCEVKFGGMTPGKRALGLRVLRDDGTPVGWRESILRNFLRPVDLLPGMWAAGLFSSLASADAKRLGDRVAGTIVVYVDEIERTPSLPEAEPLLPALALTLEEQSAVIEYAVRKPTWTAARAVELADHVSSVSGASGEEGVDRLLGMALWIEGRR